MLMWQHQRGNDLKQDDGLRWALTLWLSVEAGYDVARRYYLQEARAPVPDGM